MFRSLAAALLAGSLMLVPLASAKEREIAIGLQAAITSIDVDPKQALRAMLAQAVELQSAAVALKDARLKTAATALHQRLTSANGRAVPKEELQAYLADLWTFAPQQDEGGGVRAA